jgi:hypothetical protein
MALNLTCQSTLQDETDTQASDMHVIYIRLPVCQGRTDLFMTLRDGVLQYIKTTEKGQGRGKGSRGPRVRLRNR